MPEGRSKGLFLDPNKIRVGDLVLVRTNNKITERVQRKLGYGERSIWTHIAGSLGGYDLVEGQPSGSRVANLQDDYAAKGFQIKVLRKTWDKDDDRIKVALWWATMNNLRYDFLQLAWFWLATTFGEALLLSRNPFNSAGKKICSELITDGFSKQGYNLFSRQADNFLPADFDSPALFSEVVDIWMRA